MAEDGNREMDEARELVANRLLWPLVRDFLWNFAPQVHESWLSGLAWHESLDVGAGGGSFLVSRFMSSPRVRAHVLSVLGIRPCFHAFPREDGSRLLLLDGATLESVARWLGALACADALRRVTGGAAVRELRASLPGVYPEVFGYTAYFVGLGSRRRDAEAQGEILSDDVVNAGYSLLYSAVSALPEPVLSRLKFKLPRQDAPRLCAAAPNKAIALTAISRLLKLKFPEAYKVCCL